MVSEEVAEEKDEGFAIKSIGVLMFGGSDKLIAGTKIELVRFHDKEAEASDFIEKTFIVRYGNESNIRCTTLKQM